MSINFKNYLIRRPWYICKNANCKHCPNIKQKRCLKLNECNLVLNKKIRALIKRKNEHFSKEYAIKPGTTIIIKTEVNILNINLRLFRWLLSVIKKRSDSSLLTSVNNY